MGAMMTEERRLVSEGFCESWFFPGLAIIRNVLQIIAGGQERGGSQRPASQVNGTGWVTSGRYSRADGHRGVHVIPEDEPRLLLITAL